MVLCIFYLLCGAAAYCFFYYKTRDAMNPFGISLGLFLMAAGLSCLKLNPIQFELSFSTHFVIGLTAAEIFLAGFIFVSPLKNIRGIKTIEPTVTNNYVFLTYLLTGIVFLVSLAVWFGVDVQQIYDTANENYDMKTAVSDAIDFSRITGYILQVFPYTALFVLYDILFNQRNSKIKMLLGSGYVIWTMIFIWRVMVSRGTLLIILLGGLCLINRKYKLKLKGIFFALMGLAIAMAGLMALRMNLNSVAFSGNTSNIYFNTVYNYVAITFQVLDKLIQHGSPYSGFSSTWITLSKVLGFHDPDAQLLYTVGPYNYNARTFLYTFYHDLGILGVIVYPTLIFSIIGFLYHRAMSTKPHYILYIAMLQKPIMVLFFGNYFFGSFSNDIPYFITAFLLFLSYRPRQVHCSRAVVRHPRIKWMGVFG